ncbi:unnamed protein product [Ranitomeya imitator]|uniref:Diacylglycerol kinase accessory domain-containing protein n=1 Tax=Ranitomeya imitator TaxID=111125 RepID=A0ABN9L138_9NEOB|nr:unnamed protein product [Ranitomeya imitator]
MPTVKHPETIHLYAIHFVNVQLKLLQFVTFLLLKGLHVYTTWKCGTLCPQSWGSGADLWGSDNDNRYGKPRIDDGLLEVVGVTGVVHMGQVQGGLRSGIRIAQGSYFRVTLLKPIPVQVDGEPWIQPPGQIIISAAGPKVHMLKKSKQKQKKTSSSSKESKGDPVTFSNDNGS